MRAEVTQTCTSKPCVKAKNSPIKLCDLTCPHQPGQDHPLMLLQGQVVHCVLLGWMHQKMFTCSFRLGGGRIIGMVKSKHCLRKGRPRPSEHQNHCLSASDVQVHQDWMTLLMLWQSQRSQATPLLSRHENGCSFGFRTQRMVSEVANHHLR